MAKVLIIDDDMDSRALMKERLEYVGHKTAEAADGLIGIEKIASFEPDVILVDLIMPNADGYEVLKALRADGDTPRIPAVVLSGQDQYEALAAALQLGACDYLDKPCSFEDLLNAVHTATMTAADHARPRPGANYRVVH